MNILAEIHRRPGVNRNGRTIHRTAVRAVVFRGRNLLMIYSSNVGDYKFPGGGVADGENHLQALRREVQEECGMSVACIGSEIGAVVEYDLAAEQEYEVFKMTSHYYHCDVRDGSGLQQLDEYEQDLGFKPVWMNLASAIQLNKALLGSEKMPAWLRREIFVLEYIQKNLLPVCNT